MNQDTGSAIVTLPDGRQVGAAIHLEVLPNGNVALAVTAKRADSPFWRVVYKHRMSSEPGRGFATPIADHS